MVTGARSEDAALRAARLLVKMLQAVLAPPPPVVATAPERPALTGGVARQANDCSPGALDSAGSHTFGQTEHLAVTDAGTTASDQRAFEGLESQRLAGGDTVAERVESVVLARSESPTPSASSKGGSPSIRLTQFAVENIVATADCGLPVRLEGLAFDHKEFCSYEPELFAGQSTPPLNSSYLARLTAVTGCGNNRLLRLPKGRWGVECIVSWCSFPICCVQDLCTDITQRPP